MSDSGSYPLTQNKQQDHAVIILASGLSQRLGQAKQLLEKDGEPLVSHMTKLALSTKPKTVIIIIADRKLASYRTVHYAVEDIAKQNKQVKIVHNLVPQLGMAQSLSLGIDGLKAQQNLSQNLDIKRVLIMGVDQVLLDAEHLNQLLVQDSLVVASRYPYLDKNFATDDSKGAIVGIPLAVNFELLKKWQSELSGDKGLRYLIRALTVEQIDSVDNSKLSYDIDTPQQLAYARQRGWLDCRVDSDD